MLSCSNNWRKEFITGDGVVANVRVKAALVALLALAALILPVSGVVSAAPANYHITGNISPALGGVTLTAVNLTDVSDAYSATSAADGFYDLTVPGGTYSISAHMANYSVITAEGNKSYNESVTSNISNLDFTATELGVVVGFVDNVTAPVFEAKVVLVGADFRTYSAYSSQPRGNYSIVGVMPGVYTAHAEKSGFQTNYSQRPVTVTRGEVTYLNFSLEAQPSVLAGHVTANGNPVEGVKVSVLADGTLKYQTKSDSNGNYKITDIIPGDYTVSFSKDGYETSDFENVKLSPFNTTKLDVAMNQELLPGAGGFISGFDLSHSLMVVGFILALITVMVALVIRMRVGKRPELLPEEEEIEKD